jgi:hypothetical protein
MSNTHSLSISRGDNQAAEIAHASQTGLGLTGNFTIEAWVMLTASTISNATYVVALKYDSAGDQRGYWLTYRNVSGTEYVSVNLSPNGVNFYRVDWGNTLTQDTWTHLAVTCTIANSNSTKLILYVNGTSQGNGTVVTDPGSFSEIYANTSKFIIGNATNYNSGWQGLIDDVRVWNVVRTQSQIDDNRSTQLVGNESGLVGYWKLNNNYNDTTSNSNNLTAYNSPTFSTDVPFGGGTSTALVDMLGGIIPFAR